MSFQPVTTVSPAERRRVRRRLLVLLPALALLFGGLWFLNRNMAVKADVGECLKGTIADEMEIVDCGSADATFVVVGRVSDRGEQEAESVETVCGQWPEATHDYWRDQNDSKGVVLCLKPR
ncbi:hypothetical protein [Dactylosporangium sp. NPDC005555]|uniref:LppU/SCO3897 family protein n=1 Tax=Dactylosporangium sp. NPDC005555 TaxID=3154889 RepID=UPI0033B26B19